MSRTPDEIDADGLSGVPSTPGWLRDLGRTSWLLVGLILLLDGVAGGLKQLSSLVFFPVLTALSLIFVLKDGPEIRAWGERHLGVPLPLARTISTRSLELLRGYFFGVTLVAAFNAGVCRVAAR